MRLVLHNHLFDENGKPFRIINATSKIIMKNYDAVNTAKMISTTDFVILQQAMDDLGLNIQLKDNYYKPSEEDLQVLHHVLFEIEINKGFLVQENGKKFEIVGGIPDLETELK